MERIRPIFLISLPRSGSTLLQKMLTVNEAIHSESEPWLLLPIAYMLKSSDVYAQYNHKWACKALHDFIDILPNKMEDFNDSVRNFALFLYERTVRDDRVRFFLDKTPRYFLIIPFLAETFPDAKFIFLVRNPLDVLSSIIMTWKSKRFDLYRYEIDLFEGPILINAGCKLLQERSITVDYEKLVINPEAVIRNVCCYLDLKYDGRMATEYKNVRFCGDYGDPTGVESYEKISIDSIDKWKGTLNTGYRRYFAKKYMKFLGTDVLKTFRISLADIDREIDSVELAKKIGFGDMCFHAFATIKQKLISKLMGI